MSLGDMGPAFITNADVPRAIDAFGEPTLSLPHSSRLYREGWGIERSETVFSFQ